MVADKKITVDEALPSAELDTNPRPIFPVSVRLKSQSPSPKYLRVLLTPNYWEEGRVKDRSMLMVRVPVGFDPCRGKTGRL